jgi:DNA-binding NtrC family response regulator
MRATIDKVAQSDATVLITGESGTGKELVARALHEQSPRASGPFVAVNCGAIPESLLESELFGHKKGSFTDAIRDKKGLFEEASGGTLFLDEIGEMPLAMQAKLLRFLENRKFMRVGGSTKISVDVRLVTATLRRIEDEVKAGRFRADLFYRIQGITLRVPPLRERIADIIPLMHQFVAYASARHGTKPPRLTRATVAALRAYDWPGNIRELRNTMELLCLMREGKQARLRDLPDGIAPLAASSKPDAASGPTKKGSELLEVRLDQPLEETIDRVLRAALALEHGNRSRAARRLGLSLRTMQRYAARSAV